VAAPKPFDWSQASNADRALLFKAFQAIFSRGRSPKGVIEAALGRAVSDSYADNFKRGISTQKDIPALFAYLRDQDPAAAEELAQTLAPTATSPWTEFYKRHRTENRLAVVLHDEDSSPRHAEPPGIEQLFRDDRFYLQLDSPIDGFAIGLWGMSHYYWYWFLQGVGPTPVSKGRQWITKDDPVDDPLARLVLGPGTGDIRPISYSGKSRFPEFAVVVADHPTIERLAQASPVFDLPINDRVLDTFPVVLEASKNPWCIAWVGPSFVPSSSFYRRIE